MKAPLLVMTSLMQVLIQNSPNAMKVSGRGRGEHRKRERRRSTSTVLAFSTLILLTRSDCGCCSDRGATSAPRHEAFTSPARGSLETGLAYRIDSWWRKTRRFPHGRDSPCRWRPGGDAWSGSLMLRSAEPNQVPNRHMFDEGRSRRLDCSASEHGTVGSVTTTRLNDMQGMQLDPKEASLEPTTLELQLPSFSVGSSVRVQRERQPGEERELTGTPDPGLSADWPEVPGDDVPFDCTHRQEVRLRHWKPMRARHSAK